MRWTPAIILITICQAASSQTFEKISFNDQDQEDYYILLKPDTDSPRGVLVLLPGFGEKPESIFPESKLFNVAYANGLITMAIGVGPKLYADETVVEKLNRGLADLLKKNPGINKEDFIIGGFSAGGTISLRYAEYCLEAPEQYPIQPRGVFAVDSPVDLFDIWAYFQREIKKDYSEAGVNEARFVTDIMAKEIGTPQSNKKRYDALTPFHRLRNDAGNEIHLKDIAVRVYHDMDMEWQLTQRRRGLTDTNMLASSDLINKLLLLGNNQAEFMTSAIPGHRSRGMRHPHAWSIVDEVECIQWCLKLLLKKED